MLDLKDKNGATIIAAFHLKKLKDSYLVNQLATAYGKGNKSKGALGAIGPKDQWFVNEVAAGNLLYVNTKKADNWSNQTGLPLLPVGTTTHQLMSESIAVKAQLV